MNRIALGTVQFGMVYGIANRTGQVPLPEIRKILSAAQDAGINTLDTAIGYGTAEETLGTIGVKGWNVVSKLPEIPEEIPPHRAGKWAELQVEAAMRRLGLQELYSVLFHRPRQLLDDSGREAHAALTALKTSGKIQKIGISVYEPEDLAILLPCYDFDLVQLPMNVLDDRMRRAGFLSRLKSQRTEIHVRSVFLQGLLLQQATELPVRFHRWKNQWDSMDRYCADRSISKVALCLGSVLRSKEVDRVLVGVETAAQLEEIIEATLHLPEDSYEPGSIPERELIDPREWDRTKSAKER